MSTRKTASVEVERRPIEAIPLFYMVVRSTASDLLGGDSVSQIAVLAGDLDDVTLGVLVFEQFECHVVFDSILNEPAQWTYSIMGIVAFIEQVLLGSTGKLDADATLL